jgi:hypothetical protein
MVKVPQLDALRNRRACRHRSVGRRASLVLFVAVRHRFRRRGRLHRGFVLAAFSVLRYATGLLRLPTLQEPLLAAALVVVSVFWAQLRSLRT